MPLIAAPVRKVNPRNCIDWIGLHAADSGTSKEGKSTQLYLLNKVELSGDLNSEDEAQEQVHFSRQG